MNFVRGHKLGKRGEGRIARPRKKGNGEEGRKEGTVAILLQNLFWNMLRPHVTVGCEKQMCRHESDNIWRVCTDFFNSSICFQSSLCDANEWSYSSCWTVSKWHEQSNAKNVSFLQEESLTVADNSRLSCQGQHSEILTYWPRKYFQRFW